MPRSRTAVRDICLDSGPAPRGWPPMRRRAASIAVGLCLSALGVLSCTHVTPEPSPTASGETTGGAKAERIATGQLISPTAIPHAVQQFLNPGLPAYPSFVAGEALKSALSPDGKTLAILCAGQNSLDDSGGSARRSQLDPVRLSLRRERRPPGLARAHPGHPADQRSRRARLLAPMGGLYVIGGQGRRGLCLRARAVDGGRSARDALGHSGKGLGIEVEPNASGLAGLLRRRDGGGGQ